MKFGDLFLFHSILSCKFHLKIYTNTTILESGNSGVPRKEKYRSIVKTMVSALFQRGQNIDSILVTLACN